MELNIELGTGINDFQFGITREALQAKVGKPDEIEENDEGVDGEGKIEVWHYDDFELSAEFIEGNDWRLSTIAVNSGQCKLNEVSLIGKTTNEVISLIDSLKIGEYESEKIDMDQEHEITLLSVFDAGIDFWFEEDVLTEIQLHPGEG